MSLRSIAFALVLGLTMTLAAPNKAQACCGCDITDNDVAAANFTIARLRAHITREHNITRRRLSDFENGLMNFLTDWWDNRFRPSLEDMAEHWSVQLLNHAFIWGTFIDASNYTDVMLTMQQNNLETHRRHRPNEVGCQVTTAVASTLVRGHYATTSMQAALDRNQNARVFQHIDWGNTLDASQVFDTQNRWDDFLENFCNERANNDGMPAGCNDNILRDGDILAGEVLIENETIDDVDELKTVLALLRNLSYPSAMNPVPETALDGPIGKKTFLERRITAARQNVVSSIVHKMVGRRMPITSGHAELRDLLEQAGIPASVVSNNPSYNEVMTALTKKRFWDPEYFVRLQVDPENVAREEAILQASILMQRRDIHEILEQIALLLATEIALTVER